MSKILIDRATVEQALEALNVYASKAEHRRTHADDCAAEEAITSLKTALAEPVQEAEELKDPAEYDDFAAAIRHNERVTTRRYDSVGPVALETVYETIIHWDEGGGKRSRRELARRIVDLYTAPPQRKPLSEDEIFAIENDIPDDVISDRAWTIWLSRAVEKAHGIKQAEKNT